MNLIEVGHTLAKRVKSMKANPKIMFVSVVALLAMAACGGSSDDGAGGSVAFNVTPDSFGYKAIAGSPPGACAQGDFGDRFLINGGTAPYTVASTSPGIVVPGTSVVGNRGGSFSVTFSGDCTQESGVTILVKDALGNQKIVTVKNLQAD